jgi:DNA repair protein MmcB-like
MDNEPYRDMGHHEAVRYLAEHLSSKPGKVRTEFVLPDGKRADVAWIDAFDDVFIFEVKTAYKASLAQAAYDKYWRWCNYLFLAIPGFSAQLWGISRVTMCHLPQTERVGVMAIDRLDMPVFHPPRFHGLIGESRLKVLQSF